jgi:hypothetical protein
VIYQGGGSMSLDERLTGRLETLESALIKPKINPKGLESVFQMLLRRINKELH